MCYIYILLCQNYTYTSTTKYIQQINEVRLAKKKEKHEHFYCATIRTNIIYFTNIYVAFSIACFNV